jgi:hypothetical protein
VSATARAIRVLAFSGGGAALLAIPARAFGLDTNGAICRVWPAPMPTLFYASVYVVALALMALGWRESLRLELSLRRVMALALVVHALALIGPPFLSSDPLFYVAIGRVVSQHGSPYVPLESVLKADDPIMGLLDPGWRAGTSAYLAGWNWLCAAVSAISGGSVPIALKLLQLVATAAILGAAALAGLAARGREPWGDARAAALVAFCPLAITEATQSAHNDALLALAAGAFAFFTLRGRRTAGLAALASAIAVKANAVMALGVTLSERALERARWATSRRVLVGALLLAALSLTAILALAPRFPALTALVYQLGSPGDAFERCTRSWECLPRALLRYIFDWRVAAWGVGLAFRAGSVVWLLYAAARGAEEKNAIAWLAKALFVYYLFLHGFQQSWYLLGWLPLLPFAHAHLRPAMKLHLLASAAYYPILLCICCNFVELTPYRELVEAVIVSGIPGVYYLLCERSAMRAGRPSA